MLTLPDFKEKKIVFLSSLADIPNDLKFGNSNIRLYRDGKFVDQISCYQVLSVFILGETTITSSLIRNAGEYGISVFLLNASFGTYAEINSCAEGNYKIRKVQYTIGEQQVLDVARSIVANKVINQELLAKNLTKKGLDELLKKVDLAENIDSLRGLEGNFASEYFPKVFEKMGWYRRAPRTKEDIPNLLLDIGYTFLFNYVDSILRLFGFDTYKGFYHQLFFQRKSLSCDIMEPMRPIIDKKLIKSFNLKQVVEKDFVFKDGAYSFKTGCGKKYVGLFFEAIMENREDIYNYILGFYRHLLDPMKYKFPLFKIKCS